MIKPFPHEIIAPLKYFYGRKEESELLKKHIENSTNVLLFSKRRMGKTTLIKNVLEEIDKKVTTVYIDVYSIITAKDFGRLLLNGISKTQKGDVAKVMQKLGSLLKRVRFEPTYNPDTGKIGLKSIVQSLSFDEMIEDAFRVLFSMSKNKKIVIAIDEFQQIAEIKDVKIDAILRSFLQESQNICFIFSGSKRNLLNSLFEYKAPLFSMATPMLLEAIKKEDIYNYAKNYINISQEHIDYIYKFASGETKLIQTILYEIYISKTKRISTELIDNITNEILQSKREYYKAIFETFSPNQKKCFKLLTKYKKDLLSSDVLVNEDISKPSMQSSLTHLYKKEYIDKEDDAYFVPDRSFELWGEKFLNEN